MGGWSECEAGTGHSRQSQVGGDKEQGDAPGCGGEKDWAVG